MVRREQRRFLVETHSDYLVNRVRMAIRDGRLSSQDVSVLFFGRSDTGVEISQISIDSGGNVLGAPASYRSFFLSEEFKLLGG